MKYSRNAIYTRIVNAVKAEFPNAYCTSRYVAKPWLLLMRLLVDCITADFLKRTSTEVIHSLSSLVTAE